MPVKLLEVCTGCGKVGKVGEDLIYDEHIDRFLCDRCNMKREIRNLER
jgi:ribosomal protein S27AE